jgi:hypothetical protein
MPPPKRQRFDISALNGYHVQQLMHGWAFVLGVGFSAQSACIEQADMLAAQAAWNVLRDELVSWHISKAPGTQPWAWWAFDSPEPRQLLSDPHDCQRWAIMRRQGSTLSYGRPPIYACNLCFEECYEVQPRYLRRLGLLTGGEAMMIPEALDDVDSWWIKRYGPYDENPRAGSLQDFTQRYSDV